ncbi:patatin-like phospholipase family protein [Ferrovibrio sp.]|uniref:patatin-like phospholipase family protein n=1 Tax=Ferrovibrio sp. TaxID=1917215 RepID=UPI003D2BA983
MKLGLALSGGGTRAIAFHMGVLTRLARNGLLESVTKISTVSGGSIAVGLVMSRLGHHWPTSAEFLEKVAPSIRTLLTTTDLFSLGILLRDYRNYHLLFTDRAQILAGYLSEKWGIGGTIQVLPDSPEWIINTTSIETGKNWRVSKAVMGDWIFGRHFSPNVAIADAVAASAAVPYAIGALRLKLPVDGWYETDPATRKPTKRRNPQNTVARLWDGGAYENLGLEPIFKLDRPMIDCDEIFVSDASGWISTEAKSPILAQILAALGGNLSSPRLFDIAADQIRSLRSRMFMDAVARRVAQGALFRIGNSVRDIDLKSKNTRGASFYKSCQTDEEVGRLFRYPTNLLAFNIRDYDGLVRHGFECVDATIAGHRQDLSFDQRIWPA